MSRISRPANQTALDSWLTAKLACFRWYDGSDKYICSESHADVIVFPAPWMAATIWLLAEFRQLIIDEIRYNSLSKMRDDSQLV